MAVMLTLFAVGTSAGYTVNIEDTLGNILGSVNTKLDGNNNEYIILSSIDCIGDDESITFPIQYPSANANGINYNLGQKTIYITSDTDILMYNPNQTANASISGTTVTVQNTTVIWTSDDITDFMIILHNTTTGWSTSFSLSAPGSYGGGVVTFDVRNYCYSAGNYTVEATNQNPYFANSNSGTVATFTMSYTGISNIQYNKTNNLLTWTGDTVGGTFSIYVDNVLKGTVSDTLKSYQTTISAGSHIIKIINSGKGLYLLTSVEQTLYVQGYELNFTAINVRTQMGTEYYEHIIYWTQVNNITGYQVIFNGEVKQTLSATTTEYNLYRTQNFGWTYPGEYTITIKAIGMTGFEDKSQSITVNLIRISGTGTSGGTTTYTETTATQATTGTSTGDGEYTLRGLIFAIIDAPFNVIRNALNFDVFGVNISAFVLLVITLILVVWILKKLL